MPDSNESVAMQEPLCSACAAKNATACPHLNQSFERLMDDPMIGKTVGERYRVDALIGAGAWGRVYRVFHTGLNKAMAMKLLHSSHSFDREKLKRFKLEAESISKLDHPNICRVYDFADGPEGQPCMIMELLEGQSLSDRLKEGKTFPLDEVLQLGVQICGAMSEAHSKGIVHRDLKPGNIMLTGDGSNIIKILDFGLAKILETSDNNEKSLTETGGVLGTPAYMSPEQCQGQRVDGRTDIYALGCILYETFSGTKAFGGSAFLEVMMAHLQSTPKPLATDSASSELLQFQSVVFKCMERDAEARYQTMDELLDDLKKLRAKQTVVVARPKSQSRKTSRKLIVGCGAVVVLAAVAIGLYTMTHNPESTIPMSDSDMAALRPERVDGKSLDDLNKEIEAHPDSAEAYLARAKFHKRRDERDNAIEDYTAALRLDPRNSDALCWRADEYILVTKYDLALADAEKLLEFYPHSNSSFGMRASVYQAMENYHAAVTDATKAIELFSKYDAAYSTLSKAYSALGQHQKALDAAECSRSVDDPNNADEMYWCHYDRAMAYLRASEYQKAITALQDAQACHNKMAQSWADLAAAHAALGQMDKALPEIERATKLDLFPARAYRLRGEMYRAAGQWDKAVQEYSTSTSLEPWYGPGFVQRAMAEVATGAMTSAKLDLEKAIKLQPNSSETNSWLALVEDQLGDHVSAKQHIERAFALIPDLPVNFVNRARIEALAGDFSAAIMDCNEAIKLDSRCSQAFATRATLSEAISRHDDAAKDREVMSKFHWHNFAKPLKIASTKLASGETIVINHPTIEPLVPKHSINIVEPSLSEPRQWCLAPTHIFLDLFFEAPSSDTVLALYGGAPKSVEFCRQTLANNLNVTNGASLGAALDALANNGCSKKFAMMADKVRSMSPSQVDSLCKRLPPQEAAELKFVMDNYQAVGDKNLDAFDLVRSICYARLGYTCGYLSEEQAWHYIGRDARRLQSKYASWEDVANNYVLARNFFYGGTPGDYESFSNRVHNWLKDPQSPAIRLPYKTELSI